MISNSNNTSGKTLIAAGMMALCVVSACPVGGICPCSTTKAIGTTAKNYNRSYS